jgi:hypothetical protein
MKYYQHKILTELSIKCFISIANLQNKLRQAARESLWMKEKLCPSPKEGLRKLDENLAQIINDKRGTFKKYLSHKF